MSLLGAAAAVQSVREFDSHYNLLCNLPNLTFPLSVLVEMGEGWLGLIFHFSLGAPPYGHFVIRYSLIPPQAKRSFIFNLENPSSS